MHPQYKLTFEKLDCNRNTDSLSQDGRNLGVIQRSTDHSLVHLPKSPLPQQLINDDVIGGNLPLVQNWTFPAVDASEARARVYLQRIFLSVNSYLRKKVDKQQRHFRFKV